MAAAPRSHDQLTKCSVCGCFVRISTTLPCKHNLCMKCVSKMTKGKGKKANPACPHCPKDQRQGQTIDELAETLGRDLILEDLVTEQHRKQEKTLTSASKPLTVTNRPAVFFDLETTGLGHHCHITQIGAVGPTGSYSTFVRPKKEIEEPAQKVTGITYDTKKCQMCHRGAPVLSLPLKEALERFLDFLGAEPVVLFGHNCKRFDCPVLFNAAKACGRLEDLQKKVAGFVDTLPLFREGHRGLKSYKQELLYEHYFQESYSSHDAAADALALERLVKAAGFSTELTEKNLFCFEDIRV